MVAAEIGQKGQLRALIRERRAALTPAQLSENGQSLTEQLSLLTNRLNARSVTCFLPMRGEPDTRGFLQWAASEHIDTLLPTAREDGLLDWVKPSGEGTVKGLLGIEEPLGELLSPLAAHAVDLMLVPAAAVDRKGTRLGWGGGYFDRMLASMEHRPPVFAVVYDDEIFDELPAEPHDVSVVGAVTPHWTVEF